MQGRQKCCLHCPGTWTSSIKNRQVEHSCCLPTYVRGNLKVSSLQKSDHPDEIYRAHRLRSNPVSKSHTDLPISCHDRFAIAKKFHAENLQHQPLPDRVEDSVFKNVRPSNGGPNPQLSPHKRPGSGNRRGGSRYLQKVRGGVQYAPILGCKTPTTNMDLAICWEAPIDPTYEPSRAVHIDGTDGGPAPAIFTLVEHEDPHHETHKNPGKCLRKAVETYEAKFNNVRNHCRCIEDERPGKVSDKVPERRDQVGDDSSPDQFCRTSPEDLCEELNAIHISEQEKRKNGCENLMQTVDSRTRKQFQPLHRMNCSSCECRGERSSRKPRGPRNVQSAYAGTRHVKRNGLPVKINVPRPRTPYAKRSFCIDTLSPPFSIVNGCRDADYPEHWRLTSVYQQSYRNPRKQRGTILNYESHRR